MPLPRALHVPFLALVWCVVSLCASRLNVPRVLLPYNHHTPTNFTLKVYNGGCYKWECSRQEVALLAGVEEDGCANEVVVSAISRSPSRQTAIILAQDSGSGDVLRCDVLVDAIHNLEIITTTRELYEEEAPEAFEVQAYDSLGNQFSTLEGMEMIWELETLTGQESSAGPQSVLRFITFEESPYKVPPAIAPLEKLGRTGYMVLVEGRQTGLAKLSVRLAHSAYKHLEPASVELMVVANLLLDPADSFVLPYTRIHYTVHQLKQGHLAPIDLRGSRFYLQVADTNIAELEEDGTTVLAKTLGTTQVVLGGSHLVSSQLVRQPAASLHVVEPSHLAISIRPHNNPSLTLSRPYSFIVTVHDVANNQIFLPDNIIIHTTVPEEYFLTEFATRNGSYIHGTPIATGKTTVTAVLSAVEVGDEVMEISPPLRASQDIEIFEPVVVMPPLTVLPWDPVTRPLYSVNLTAKGGSGSVGWSSSDTEVVVVTQAGVCRTRGLGSVTVTAAMTANPHNKDSAQIHIMEAVGLSLLPGEVEVEVEAHLPLHVGAHTLYQDVPLPFTACHKLPLAVEPREPSFSALPDVLPPTVEGSCAIVEVVARKPGFSLVNVSYHSSSGIDNQSQDHQLQLTASTTVAAYRPLRPVNPSSGETVLALGSSRLVVFEGGPLPWPLKPSSHTTKVTVGEGDKVEARLVKQSSGQQPGDQHLVEAMCRELGQTTIVLTVANTPSAFLPHPKKVSTTVTVICALPDTISLIALIRRPTGTHSPCPAMAELGRAVAHCHKPLNMEVVVTDSEQRRFDNISSLALEWEVSNISLAAVPKQQLSVLPQSVSAQGQGALRSYQVLNPFGESGELVVTVHLVGYTTNVEATLDIPPLSTSLPLVLVHDAALDPPAATLYHHTHNKLDLNVVGGSGFFELQPPDIDIATLDYHEAKKTVAVSPLGDGELVVTLVDVCLEATHPATSHIRIASVASLDLTVLEVVELGGTLEAEVVALDSSGTPLPAHSLMDLQPHPQSTVISAKYQGVNKQGNAVYEVRGRHVGDTSLRVSAAVAGGTGEGGRPRVESPTRPIQVFPALTLHPRNITLVVGAVYQVETRGGPYPSPSVEYSIDNGTVANSSHAGVVTALALGTTTLTARAVSVSQKTSRRAIYSQDMVTIHVVPLPKIRIHAPLTRLETGATMPLLALGVDEHQAPPAYASATPPLLLEWATSNKQVASLPGVFQKTGVVENTENQGATRLKAERPGRATISLKVRVGVNALPPYQQILSNAVLTDKLEIKVFESLKLKYPSGGSSQLLMTPESEARIVTNRDGDGQMTYQVDGACNGHDEGSPVVEVGPDGLVKAGEQTGQATVVVTVTESYGVTQSLSVLVEVKKVSYLQGEVGGLVGAVTSAPLTWLPVGASFNLQLSYHDNRGRIFHATNAQPAFRPSRFDLVGVTRGATNDSLVVRVVGRGQTVLHLWDHNLPLLNDYLRIHAGPAITPDRATTPMGVHICFSSQVAGEAGAPTGNWSTQGNILSLDSASGVAISHQPGQATVLFQASPSLTTTTELTVLPLTQITVSSPHHPLTNGREGARQVAGVELGAEGSTIPPCYPQDPPTSQPPFSCSVTLFPSLPGSDVGELFSAAPIYVPNQGYGCEVTCLAGPSLGLATLEAALVVEAVAEGDGGLRSGQVQLPFLPAPAPESPTLTLTNQQPTASLLLRGHPDVLAAMAGVDGCVGGLECQLGVVRGQERTLTVASKESLWNAPLPDAPLEVNVTSPLTTSIVQVSIVLESVGDGVCTSPPAWDMNFLTLLFSERLLVSLACLALTAICLFVGYHALLTPSYRQTQHNGVFANSPAPPPAMKSFQPVVSSSPTGNITTPVGSGRSSPQGYTLWSDTTEPVYGAPPYSRRAYQGSPTYTTTPPRLHQD
ncbi:nuclear pore membrane glycoprotein 210-like [Portunus trituberculatus]|uniref:nuclear pore membrane glycoprotein 210-like n=1 Tax=Portunus trituberculatus TaxID=210409 RepID=UPI001E1D170E|nr:nuclear pore membrane glycoprotein 210-like [Portunus trituberculatus]